MTRVLFVCLGNICRSPTAHGVFEAKVRAGKLEDRVQVDSCGTGDWHIGHAPDRRARPWRQVAFSPRLPSFHLKTFAISLTETARKSRPTRAPCDAKKKAPRPRYGNAALMSHARAARQSLCGAYPPA